MDRGIKVLSLFDGVSCGRVALQRAGIPVKRYFASEIDKHAIKIAIKNYPDIIQLGSVTDIHYESGGEDTGLSFADGYYNCEDSDGIGVDLLIGGSPCQGFSNMGDGLNFEDPRSRLFWEYVRLLKEIRVHNPNVKFLLENVKMKKEWRDIISAALGVEPILINSALVSAQNRERYYWTNIVPIDQIQQPEDRGIFMDDILIDGIAVLNDTRGENPRGVHEVKKANCICAHYGKGPDNHGQRTFVLKEYTPHEKIKSGKCIEVGHADIPGYDIRKRVYSTKGKSPAATAHTGGHHHIKIAMDKSHWRKLLPLECERLQTLPDNYTEGISDTQRYRCVGNGWNIDTIVHLLKYYRP